MKGRHERKCRGCRKPFEARNRAQIYCLRERCRRERHLRYMQRYMPRWKARHPDYWKTEKQREYLRKWRAAHPEYFREWREREKKKRARVRKQARRVPQHA